MKGYIFCNILRILLENVQYALFMHRSVLGVNP